MAWATRVQWDFYFLAASRLDLGPTQPHILRVTFVLTRG